MNNAVSYLDIYNDSVIAIELYVNYKLIKVDDRMDSYQLLLFEQTFLKHNKIIKLFLRVQKNWYLFYFTIC